MAHLIVCYALHSKNAPNPHWVQGELSPENPWYHLNSALQKAALVTPVSWGQSGGAYPETAFLRSAAPGRPSPPSRRALHQTGPSLHREWGILLPVIALSYGRTITHFAPPVKDFSPGAEMQEKIHSCLQKIHKLVKLWK